LHLLDRDIQDSWRSMNSALETQSTRYTNNVDCDYGIFYLSFGIVLETLTAVRWGEV